MAKVQGKKTAVAKRVTSRPAARAKSASTKKAAKKPEAPKARAAKAAAKAKKPVAKPVAKKPVAKTALKAVKPVAASKPKPAPAPKAVVAPKAAPAPKAVAAPKPAPAPKAVAAPKPAPAPKAAAAPKAAPAPKPAPKAVEKVQPKPALAPVPKPGAAPRPAAPRPAASTADDKKRARRSRPRVTSSGGPVANWLQSGEKPRSSSFIPAPPRAEAPSLVAAPPASSDRLIRNEDLVAPAVRTVPVRVDVEAGSGRVYIYPNPLEVSLKPGEGIEWDFRYLGGADVTVDEVVIEFDKPSPFSQHVFRCKKPGIGRPQRQLSGGATQAASGRRAQYTLRAMTAFKTELGTAKLSVTIS
jgi:hypothetical protein